MAAYFELHIEQSLVLEAARVPIGIVRAITGIRQYRVTYYGGRQPRGGDPDGPAERFAGGRGAGDPGGRGARGRLGNGDHRRDGGHASEPSQRGQRHPRSHGVLRRPARYRCGGPWAGQRAACWSASRRSPGSARCAPRSGSVAESAPVVLSLRLARGADRVGGGAGDRLPGDAERRRPRRPGDRPGRGCGHDLRSFRRRPQSLPGGGHAL